MLFRSDVRAIVTVTSHTVQQQQEMATEAGGSDAISNFHPEHSWISVRAAEIAAKRARKNGDTNAHWKQFIEKHEVVKSEDIVQQNYNFAISWEVGGATTLNGAAYFEFFTWLMLGTAIVFVGVGFLYKPKTYIQDGA